MQYKIPVQIENEDPIILWLSIRQLFIIVGFAAVWYSVYQSLFPIFWTEVSLIPTIIIVGTWILIAVFKYSEMTFMQFILSFIRYKVNLNTRKWQRWVDSFWALDIWYVASDAKWKENKVDFEDKINKMKEIDEKINKI